MLDSIIPLWYKSNIPIWDIYTKEGKIMYCYHCGKQVDDDADFCPFCGKVVNVRYLSEQVDKKPLESQKTENIPTFCDSEYKSYTELCESELTKSQIDADNGVDTPPRKNFGLAKLTKSRLFRILLLVVWFVSLSFIVAGFETSEASSFFVPLYALIYTHAVFDVYLFLKKPDADNGVYEPPRKDFGLVKCTKVFWILISAIYFVLLCVAVAGFKTFDAFIICAYYYSFIVSDAAYYFKRVAKGEKISIGFKVCTLICVSRLLAILMFCDKEH